LSNDDDEYDDDDDDDNNNNNNNNNVICIQPNICFRRSGFSTVTGIGMLAYILKNLHWSYSTQFRTLCQKLFKYKFAAN